MSSNKQIVREAFDAWSRGEAHVSAIFDPDMRWEIVGRSAAAGPYVGAQQFIDEVLNPFAARFAPDEPFRPVRVRGMYADGDTVVVAWDGEGKTRADTTYSNVYAWFLTMRDGRVVGATAFFDSIAFDELWHGVPAPERASS